MIIFPNAKINLGLKVINRRDDGYHNIETVLYPINIKDALEIVEFKELQFSYSGIKIPASPGDNLCMRAWHLIAGDFGLPNVHMHLHKQIPIGAGLGGGSSDAAFCIRLINDKFNLGLSISQMQDYARQLGSDCAFFINNTPVMASGKGDVLSNIHVTLKNYYLILVMPPIQISTLRAYQGVMPGLTNFDPRLPETLAVEEWRNFLVNDFEKSVFKINPEIKKIKEFLYNHGALYASMSGSGASVYGIFKQEIKLPELQQHNFVFYDI
ncbi:MAG: 4-(cytidine 5'-diphospho)-2-C-methyl-D-erythritol kinase [Flavobacterium sp.]|nr:4-(cytidine 5'-diphospho)-2-C-methyl-D-erythritol kinase [Pedobacter sp.]